MNILQEYLNDKEFALTFLKDNVKYSTIPYQINKDGKLISKISDKEKTLEQVEQELIDYIKR